MSSMSPKSKEARSVDNNLELLLKLQVIDYDLGELERSKDYLPDMMENLTREIDETRTSLEDTAKKLEDSRLEHQKLELDLKTKERDLQKYQQQMMSIKTNKEYDALVAEIDVIKQTISDHETRIIQTMEAIESLEKQVEELKEKESQVVNNNEKQLQVLQEKVDSIGAKVSDKQAERKSVISSIPRSTLSAYERIRRGRGGRAIVPVKKRACSSCFKALTPKKVQELRRGNDILTCDYCGSLLYWDEDISA